MKPIPTIIEKQQVDVELLEQQCIVGYADLQTIEKRIVRTRAQLDDAIAAAKVRRLQLGQWLSQARTAWPERGPTAKGWGEFCERVKIPDSTARAYIAEYRDPAGFAERKAGSAKPEGRSELEDDDQTGPRIVPAPTSPPVLFAELTPDQVIDAIKRLKPEDRKRVLRDGKANVIGGSKEVERGTWCTPRAIADAVGPWDVDPFANPRSHIAAVVRCMLEDGGDGFGGGKPGETPGLYLTGSRPGLPSISGVADETTRVWIQSPYEIVLEAIAHYGHTRFCALLRWSPDTEWFARMWPRVQVVAFPVGGALRASTGATRIEFEPPDGIEASSNPYPHALYYADERDVTDAVRKLCIVLPVNHKRYDPASLRSAQRIVE